MNLSFVLHAHQPPGNFDSVFEHGFRVTYGPVLDLIEERPGLRLSMHWSGSLLEWMEEHVPERIEQLRRLVRNQQVEMVAAGMYEPVLALLPPRDRVGQIRAHRAYLRQLFDVDATVGWLTERVWEPTVAEDLVAGGIRAVALDDQHFYSAGVADKDLDHAFLTEHQGSALLLAASRGQMRALIPWQPVDRALEVIRNRAGRGASLLTYADDIEKFGMWPGTYESVIRSGWLAEFFDGLLDLEIDAGANVDVLPFGEAIDRADLAGRVYIPDASYPEMLEWSLPAPAQRRYSAVRERLDEAGLTEEVVPFLKPGIYFQFLAKYPEANHLHKRMLDVSRRCERLTRRVRSWHPDDLPEAVRELFSAQANCAYWHGMFGGIYLPHIRQRLWHHLIRAEAALERAGRPTPALRTFDLDADLEDEHVVTTAHLIAVVDPSEGALVELSHRASAVNLVDTIARREESYHETGERAPYLYDTSRRAVFVDRLLPGRPPARNRPIMDLAEFEASRYRGSASAGDGVIDVMLKRVSQPRAAVPVIHKHLSFPLDAPEVGVEYTLSARGTPVDARFGVEVNLGLLFREQLGGTVRLGEREFALPRGGAARDVVRAELTVDGVDVGVTLEVEPPAHVDVRPIETVARSEAGYDRTLQQLSVLLSWPLKLRDDEEFTPGIRLRLESRDAGHPAHRA